MLIDMNLMDLFSREDAFYELMVDARNWFCDHRVAIIGGSVAVGTYLLLRDPVKDYMQRRFKELYVDVYLEELNRLLHPFRETLRKRIAEQCNDLPAGKTLRILEIGMGPGCSLEYYPKDRVEVIAVEPNPYFVEILKKKQVAFPIMTRIIEGYSEDLSEVADASIDVVVSTLTLCSVNSLRKSLEEVKRVLVKGGRFYFYEHQASPDDWRRYLTQLVYNPYWKLMYDGCHLTRRISQAIAHTGFDVSHLREITSNVVYVLDPQLYGYAINA